MMDPPTDWAKPEFCGDWPCTGPSNAVYTFKDAVFSSNDGVTALPTFWTASTTKYSFQLVSDFTQAASTYANCKTNDKWNAWLCADPAQTAVPQIGHLVFESLDNDFETRNMQPVVITNTKGYKNVINSFMDHTFNGVDTQHKRLSRFVSQVEMNQSYTLTFTGNPFKNGRYMMKADSQAKGILVKVPYPEAGAYSVKVDGTIVNPQPWDETTKQMKPIDVTTASCGANMYVGVVNYLQFFITPGCSVTVIPRDAILTAVRLQWTAAEFFAGDGATTFTQRLASSLGIDITRVKIVSVYEGSLNVEVQILDDESVQIVNEDESITTTAAAVTELNQVQAKMMSTLSTNDPTVLGAPVLEIQAKVVNQYLAPPPNPVLDNFMPSFDGLT